MAGPAGAKGFFDLFTYARGAVLAFVTDRPVPVLGVGLVPFGSRFGQAAGVEVDRLRFEQLVADALDSIPESLGRLMQNVAVLVEDWPTREQMGGRGGTLLGLYEGIDLTRRSPLSYTAVMPDRITIFRGPISSISSSEPELVKIVTETVIHEVAHHFGISDARLRELGW